MNVLHKSLNLSRFAQVSVCPVIYGSDGSFMGEGGVKNQNGTLAFGAI